MPELLRETSDLTGEQLRRLTEHIRKRKEGEKKMNDHRKSAAGSAIPFLHKKQLEREAALLLDEYAMKF